MISSSLFNEPGRPTYAINGPTDQPAGPFCWSSSAYDNDENPHVGMPDCFDFEWELFTAVGA